MLVGIAVGDAGQHHFAAAGAHGVDFDLRRGFRHHDGGLAAEQLRRHRHPLRVVAGAGGDHAFLQRFGRQLGHFVVGAADFEGKHRLQIFALEQDGVAGAPRQVGGGFKRGFDCGVVYRGGQDADQIVGILGVVVDVHIGCFGAWQKRRNLNAAAASAQVLPPPFDRRATLSGCLRRQAA